MATKNDKEKKIQIPHVIKLIDPIKWEDGKEVTEFTVYRKLKAKDFRKVNLQNMSMGDMFGMISAITNETQALIDELSAEDMFALVEVVNSFLPSGLATGNSL